jgi:hypothetical protein
LDPAATNGLQVQTKGAVDISGVSQKYLQTIYEQLLLLSSENGDTRFNVTDNSGNTSNLADTGILAELPFKASDKVVFYIRPKLYLNIEVQAGFQNISSIVGVGDTQDYLNSAAEGLGDSSTIKYRLFNRIFTNDGETTGTTPKGFQWLADISGSGGTGTVDGDLSGSRHPGANTGLLSQASSNLLLSTTQLQALAPDAHGLFDAHIWKIEVTLS